MVFALLPSPIWDFSFCGVGLLSYLHAEARYFASPPSSSNVIIFFFDQASFSPLPSYLIVRLEPAFFFFFFFPTYHSESPWLTRYGRGDQGDIAREQSLPFPPLSPLRVLRSPFFPLFIRPCDM